MGEELTERGLTLVLMMTTPSTEMLEPVVTGMKPAAVMSLAPFGAANRSMLAHGSGAVDPAGATLVDNQRIIGALQVRALIERGHTRLAYAHLHDVRQNLFGGSPETAVREAAAQAGISDIQVVHVDIDTGSASKGALNHSILLGSRSPATTATLRPRC